MRDGLYLPTALVCTGPMLLQNDGEVAIFWHPSLPRAQHGDP